MYGMAINVTQSISFLNRNYGKSIKVGIVTLAVIHLYSLQAAGNNEHCKHLTKQAHRNVEKWDTCRPHITRCMDPLRLQGRSSINSREECSPRERGLYMSPIFFFPRPWRTATLPLRSRPLQMNKQTYLIESRADEHVNGGSGEGAHR